MKKIHGIKTHQKAKVTGTAISRRYRKRELNTSYWNLTLENSDWSRIKPMCLPENNWHAILKGHLYKSVFSGGYSATH
jgi:hypothetical protein